MIDLHLKLNGIPDHPGDDVPDEVFLQYSGGTIGLIRENTAWRVEFDGREDELATSFMAAFATATSHIQEAVANA